MKVLKMVRLNCKSNKLRGVKLLFWASLWIIQSCNQVITEEGTLFKLIAPQISGIDFVNALTESDTMNYFIYPYIYMGGGVSVGDINNDGLSDIYFTGNMTPNKLYLNKGGLQFTDISEVAGVQADNRWSTGTTMADVNGDGYLDIYVSVAGKYGTKKNLLYINNQDSTFTERAEEYRVAGSTNSIQSTFFDYDLDGDLDLYVANYPIIKFTTSNQAYKALIDNPPPANSDKLYRNENGAIFTDVTEESGILNFGLSVSATIGDFNNDQWPDIYVSNDFSTPDYFYINNGDGTFSEKSKSLTQHTSWYGMGTDIADVNNDALLDFVQLDMTPKGNRRSKSNMASMNRQLFHESVDMGFHYQYMQNCLQLNNGSLNDEILPFSDIARLANIATTDWSWGVLMADLDNDGWKDIFVTNGVRREINNKDYFRFLKTLTTREFNKNMLKYALDIPSEKVDNYVYRNRGDLTFDLVTTRWGLNFVGFSNGVSYGDLDNDGDLDLVVSNIDSVSTIYENRSSQLSGSNFLRFKLEGPELNRFGIGAKVRIDYQGTTQFQELTLTRGYQSSVEPYLHFGLGDSEKVDLVVVVWPDRKKEIIKNPKLNSLIVLKYQQAAYNDDYPTSKEPLFADFTSEAGIDFVHHENEFDDFEKEPLLPHRMSQFGPGLAIGDANGDGLEDFFIGGAKGQASRVFIQANNGRFKQLQRFDADSDSEDMGAVFFDADGDGDMDLYVVSGGNEFEVGSSNLQDRLYLNQGNLGFIKSNSALPKLNSSGSRVVTGDYDNDGDLDLFVGGRQVPGRYPTAARSYLLRNDSDQNKVQFTDVTEQLAPQLTTAGMVTDAVWVDFDDDDRLDLVVVGEWMPISFFKNTGDGFVQQSFGLDKAVGWWFSIDTNDFDNDGDSDLVVGNLGENYKYQASKEATFDVYYSDFDRNGNGDIVLGYYDHETQYPVRGRECSSEQIPDITRKYQDYASFATASLEDIYTEQMLETSVHYQATTFSSVFLENTGEGFELHYLPKMAQISSVNGIISEDFNRDGNLDLLIAGNLFVSEIETPRNDAGLGLLLLGDGKNNFTPLPASESGINLPYDVKDLKLIDTKNGKSILAAVNDDSLRAFHIQSRLPLAAIKTRIH